MSNRLRPRGLASIPVLHITRLNSGTPGSRGGTPGSRGGLAATPGGKSYSIGNSNPVPWDLDNPASRLPQSVSSVLRRLSSCFLSFVYIDINCLFQSPDSRFRTNRQEFVDLRQFVSFARIGGIGGIVGGLFACVRVYTINMCSVHLYASRHSCICLCCVYMCLSCSTDVIFVERQRELT